jgi:hypothetical protein
MTSIRTGALLAALLTTLLPVHDARAQTLARPLAAPAPNIPLRSVYGVRVESAWPTPPGETDACNNRASEVLVGTLHRAGNDRYDGRFVRRTRLGFCGTHAAAVDRCGLLLLGEGEVTVEGRVSRGADGISILSLTWHPVSSTTRLLVDGNCAPRFTAALEAMYRTAVHSVEFAVPAGEGPWEIALEDYGRRIELR